MAMNLKDWRKSENKTLAEVALALGVAGGARTVHRIEGGQIDADADMAEKLLALTDGKVTPLDLHQMRLDWLKVNRPERFADGVFPSAERQAAP